MQRDERAFASVDLRRRIGPPSPRRSAAVDAVTFFDEDTPRELIAALLPDVLVKGADWSHFIAGREEVEAAGGVVKTIPLEAGFSTTNLVEQILQALTRGLLVIPPYVNCSST